MDKICSWNRRRWTKVLYENYALFVCVFVVVAAVCVSFRLNSNKKSLCFNIFYDFFSIFRNLKDSTDSKVPTTRLHPWNVGKNRDISIKKYNINSSNKLYILFVCVFVTVFFALSTVSSSSFCRSWSSNIENINEFSFVFHYFSFCFLSFFFALVSFFSLDY